MQFETIVALVPMRHHSQRVPQKNFRKIAGKPLYHHIVTTLMNCPEVSQIAVDTDSEVILEGLRTDFPEVVRIKRPDALSGDTVPMNDVLMYDASQVAADLYLQTHSTNPLIKADTLSRAINVFKESSEVHDSLFSVTRLQTRLWDAQTKPLNHDVEVLLQTQDLPPVFEENSCIYLFTAENLKRRNNRMGEKPLMFEMDPVEALDIDEESDFQIAEILLQMRQEGKLV
jgi:CMP-N-acetylneuraminic acid synthetase